MMPQMVEYNNNLIVSGSKLAPGEFGSISTIYFLNEKLEEVWSYTFNEYRSNLIDEVSVFDDKIFITGMEGELANTYKNTKRFIIVLDLKGNLLLKEKLGKCQFLQSTPLVKIDREIINYYNTDTTIMRNPSGEYFSLNVTRISLDDLTIQDGPVSMNQKLRTGHPCEIIHFNNKSYLLGLTSLYNNDYCFIKSISEYTQEPERLVSSNLLTQFDLQVGEGSQTKILYNINYYDDWQGHFISLENILNTDSLSISSPSIRFDSQPNDIYAYKEHIYFLETVEHYKKYDLVVSDLSGNILSRDALDFIPDQLVVNDDYYYFLDKYSGAKIIRKPR